MEAVDGDFGGGVVPGDFWVGGLDGFDEFDLEAIVVLELEDGEAELFDSAQGDAGFGEAGGPVVGGVLGDCEREACGLSEPDGSLRALGPGEEGDEGAGGALGVAVVEVICAGVVVVDGNFDEAEAEDAGEEIDVPLGVAAHGGDVVDASNLVGHGFNNETMRFVVPGDWDSSFDFSLDLWGWTIHF